VRPALGEPRGDMLADRSGRSEHRDHDATASMISVRKPAPTVARSAWSAAGS
jgi:hypothetical protein